MGPVLNQALEDQAVVAQEDRRLHRSQCPEPFEASRFHPPLRLLDQTAERELVVDGLPTMAINYRRKMRQPCCPQGTCVTSKPIVRYSD